MARPEAEPSPLEQLEEAEFLGIVATAVLALDEPHREVILALYYHGWSMARIAAESGTSLTTVRTRLREGHELLRRQFDRKTGGDRARWAVVLVRLASSSTSTDTWTRRLPMQAKLGGAIVASFVAVATIWAFWRDLDVPVLGGPELADSATSRGSSGHSTLDAPVVPPLGRTAQLVGPTEDPALHAKIQGQFMFAGNTPGVGVGVAVHGWNNHSDVAALIGEPNDWIDPTTKTGSDGRFVLSFNPPPYRFRLKAKAPGYGGATWEWPALRPGVRIDLGKVELPIGGVVQGRILDPSEQPLLGERWEVQAISSAPHGIDGRTETVVSQLIDPQTGGFRLNDVWPGPVRLIAHSRLAGWIYAPIVVVHSGVTTTQDIVYSGPPNSKRITVVASCTASNMWSQPAPSSVKLYGSSGEPRAARELTSQTHTYSFEDLSAESYELVIEDPRYVRWSRVGVMPGESVIAALEGASAVRLAITDNVGSPIDRFAVRVKFRNVSFSPSHFEVHDGNAPLPEGTLRGLIPGDYTLQVRLPDGSCVWAEVDNLIAGETRFVEVSFRDEPFVIGRVAYADGTPVPATRLSLFAPDPGKDPKDQSMEWRWSEKPTGRDAAPASLLNIINVANNGRFRMSLPGQGSFFLSAESNGASASSDTFTWRPGETVPELRLVLRRQGTVRGHIRAAGSSLFSGLSLWIIPVNANPPDKSALGESFNLQANGQRLDAIEALFAKQRVSIARDGGFEVTLSPGPSRALLVLDSAVQEEVQTVGEEYLGTFEIGTIDVPEGGVLEQDFTVAALPSLVTFVVGVNGTPAVGAQITLHGGDGTALKGVTDENGRFGAVRAWTGTWILEANDPTSRAWFFTRPVSVEEGETVVRIDTDAVPGVLLCLDLTGEPIANEFFQIWGSGLPTAEGRSVRVHPRKSDSQGRLSLTLMPGEYSIRRTSKSRNAVSLIWTDLGPLDDRMRF